MTITTLRKHIAASPTQTSVPRLRMEPTGAHRTLLDGGWWPRSTDPATALAGLVLAIDGLRGPVTRLVLSAHGWDSRLHRLRVADRVLRLGHFSSQPASLLTALCDNGDRVDLLVVAPGTEPGTADAAMLMAATSGNLIHAQHILAHLDTCHAPTPTTPLKPRGPCGRTTAASPQQLPRASPVFRSPRPSRANSSRWAARRRRAASRLRHTSLSAGTRTRDRIRRRQAAKAPPIAGFADSACKPEAEMPYHGPRRLPSRIVGSGEDVEQAGHLQHQAHEESRMADLQLASAGLGGGVRGDEHPNAGAVHKRACGQFGDAAQASASAPQGRGRMAVTAA